MALRACAGILPTSTTQGNCGALLFLGAASVIDTFVWGLPCSFGVFQTFYETHAAFGQSPWVPMIGTTASGLLYVSAAIAVPLLHVFPNCCRASACIGMIVLAGALLAASFATNVVHLILAQGIGYAIGGSMLFFPTLILIDHWFCARKRLAMSIMLAGGGAGGMGFPPLIYWLLSNYGQQTALRVVAVVVLLTISPLLLFVRAPSTCPLRQQRVPRCRFLRDPRILLPSAGVLMQAMGFFIPPFYLPSYLRVVQPASYLGYLLVLLFNLATIVGCIALGALLDSWVSTSTGFLISGVGSGMTVLGLWGTASSLAQLVCFAVFHGIFAGSFSALFPGVARDVARNMGYPIRPTEESIVVAVLFVARGVGTLVSGCLSGRLSRAPLGTPLAGYHSRYGLLILLTGLLFFVSAIGSGTRFYRRRDIGVCDLEAPSSSHPHSGRLQDA